MAGKQRKYLAVTVALTLLISATISTELIQSGKTNLGINLQVYTIGFVAFFFRIILFFTHRIKPFGSELHGRYSHHSPQLCDGVATYQQTGV